MKLALNLKLSQKLPLVIVGAAFATGLAIGVWNYFQAASALGAAAESKLGAMAENRKAALETYLAAIRDDLTVTAAGKTIREALTEFQAGFEAEKTQAGGAEAALKQLYIDKNPNPAGEKIKLEDAGDGSAYSQTHRIYHPWLRKLVETSGYYDLFLIAPNGDVVYTAFKEQDFASNLATGQWKDTDLGAVFRAARDNAKEGYVAFSDLAPYAPSNGVPAGFIATPVLDGGQLVGVLAYQMPIGAIDKLMQDATGLGESGESYLVGKDLLMRSDSRFEKDPTILKAKVDTEAAHHVLNGETGSMISIDRHGMAVEVAYQPVEFEGVTWGVIAEIDSAEALAAVSSMRNYSLMGGAAVLAVITLLGFLLARSITRPIASATGAMEKLADGNDEIEIEGEERRDEIGAMWQAMRKLRNTVSKAFELGQMIEEVPINLMQCDPKEFKVTFMNRSTRETLKKLENLLPCKVEQILGQSIDIFHKNPEHQRRILRDPKNLPYTAKIKLGEESLSLNVAAIMDRKGGYMGPVLTWNVVTAQVNMANRVKDVVGIVASAATEMEASAESLSATAEETNRQSTAVAAASEQAATNVQTVASAAEELSASIREITSQMTTSARIAQQAVEQVDRTNTTVKGLAEAAEKIGEVVNLISDIASQTNLLALNATIEAARAGEAGKGFAVVASEVKNLANQTAKATEEIGQQIAAMQTATGDSVQAIRGIGETIKQISEVTTAVASAVEEQGAATQEISRNVQQASAGTQEVSSNITGVSQAATQTGTAAGQVLNAARELAQQGQQLNTEIESFLRSA
jgi:methyl-accepting chemotaxis protein